MKKLRCKYCGDEIKPRYGLKNINGLVVSDTEELIDYVGYYNGGWGCINAPILKGDNYGKHLPSKEQVIQRILEKIKM